MRKKAPRADRLDKIRDFAIILHKNDGMMGKSEFIREIMKSISPPQLNSWTVSNIREYIAALEFLRMAISLKRKSLYLRDLGREIATEGKFGVHKLNETEKTIFRNAIFQNDRFRIFLTLFTKGRVPRDQSEFVLLGNSIKLRYAELQTELDRREVQDIFKSWALSTEIIEWNSGTKEFFPVLRKNIPYEQFFRSIKDVYKQVEHKIIRRAEIYKIKDIVCYKYRIPCQQFYESLIEISTRYPDKVHLEMAPITMMPIQKFKIEMAEKFGIVTDKGIYYYVKITNSVGW